MPYICMATDGVRFRTYTPTLKDPKKASPDTDDVELNLIEETDWNNLELNDIYFWIDRYFLRNEPVKPTTESTVRDFGINSQPLKQQK